MAKRKRTSAERWIGKICSEYRRCRDIEQTARNLMLPLSEVATTIYNVDLPRRLRKEDELKKKHEQITIGL